MTPTLYIKAEQLSVGDVLCLPFEKTATIEAIRPFGPRSRVVQFKTQFGWSRISRNERMFVEARVS